MADLLFLRADSPDFRRHEAAMRLLLEREACKLGVANPGAYFANDNDYVLALAAGELVGLCVTKQSRLSDATYIGYMLLIIRPDTQSTGLMAKMIIYYALRILPGLMLRSLRNWRHRSYFYADIGTPMVYAKIHHLKVPMYPDLIRGETAAQRQVGMQLRQQLVTCCGIRDMWQRPGFVRDVDLSTGIITDSGDGTPKADAPAKSGGRLDRHWAVRWSEYVPAGADLLVVLPVQPWTLLKKMRQMLQFGFTNSKRLPRLRRPVKAASA